MRHIHAIASHCICCGRPLTDPESVNRGMGPECSEKGYEIPARVKDDIYALTCQAAVCAEKGEVHEVVRIVRIIKTKYDMDILADKMFRRFKNAEKNAKIEIKDMGDGRIAVRTPFRRKYKHAFVSAWRAIPHRTYDYRSKFQLVPSEEKAKVWGLLKRFFPGEFGKGPKGLFRIPVERENSGSQSES